MDNANLKHEFFMHQVLKLAAEADNKGEVPVGAIIESEGQILAKTINSVQTLRDATAHAEMIAISAACNFLDSRYLKNCTLYVNLEPCPMCMTASFWAQIKLVVYGASDKRFQKNNFDNCRPNTIPGVLEYQCSKIINDFFSQLRK